VHEYCRCKIQIIPVSRLQFRRPDCIFSAVWYVFHENEPEKEGS